MHGRICAGLLVILFLPASLAKGQTAEGQRDSSDSLASTKPPGLSFPSNPQRKGPVTAISLAPANPGLPPLLTPIPEPEPWRPPASSTSSGFAQLARKAGIIFSGTVVRINRSAAAGPGEAVGTVEITFHVENAIRGTTAGEFLTVTQWIGIWSSGQRYRVGERLLLFLYPRSRVGLTSCVGAHLGRFTLDSSGRVWLSAQQMLAFRQDPVLGRKVRVGLSDFAWAVRQAGEEQ